MGNEKHSEIKKRAKSFQFAFEGCLYVLRTQKNAWIHAVITLGVVILAIWLVIPRQDWALLIITIAMVWMAEFFNTAVESIVDMMMPKPHPMAKVAKDVSAGAVLMAALAAVIVGLLILGPPLWSVLAI